MSNECVLLSGSDTDDEADDLEVGHVSNPPDSDSVTDSKQLRHQRKTPVSKKSTATFHEDLHLDLNVGKDLCSYKSDVSFHNYDLISYCH